MVCTDLDGTLLGKLPRPDDVMAFRAVLLRLRRQYNAVWTIATGRRLDDLQAILMEFMTTGLIPDFLILEDAYIFKRNNRGRFSPFRWWNRRIRRQRMRLSSANGDTLSKWRAELMSAYPEARDRARQTVDLWLEFDEESHAAEAETMLRARLKNDGQYLIFRWGVELCLAPAAGTKGEAVHKVAATLGLKKHELFAVGDGPNDITMLDGSVAGMPASVGNALCQVKDIVRHAGGYLCEQNSAKGVVEALNYYSALRPDEFAGP